MYDLFLIIAVAVFLSDILCVWLVFRDIARSEAMVIKFYRDQELANLVKLDDPDDRKSADVFGNKI